MAYMKKTSSGLLLAALALISVQHASANPSRPVSYGKIGLLAFLAGSYFGALNLRESEPDFKPQGNVKDLLKLSDLKNNPGAYWANLKDVYYDRFVGQKLKKKGVVVGADGVSLQITKSDCLPYGVLGTIDAWMKPHEATAKSIAFIAVAMSAFKSPEKFMEWIGWSKAKDNGNGNNDVSALVQGIRAFVEASHARTNAAAYQEGYLNGQQAAATDDLERSRFFGEDRGTGTGATSATFEGGRGRGKRARGGNDGSRY